MVSSQRNIYSWKPSRRLRVDEDVIERTCKAFSIDPTKVIDCPIGDSSNSCPRLSKTNIRYLFKFLAERTSKKDARKIVNLVDRWKDGIAKNQTDAFEYELIAKTALDSDAPVRYREGRDYSVSESEQEVYRDLYRISQAFIFYNYKNKTTIYRGIRNISVAKLFAQALDRPNASKYVLDTSVISNFTATKEVSHEYSTGIVVKPPLERDNAVMMVDHIFRTSKIEDEIHVAGGKLSLPPERVVHLGNHTSDERKIQTTSKNLESQGGLSQGHLEDIFTILEIMGDNEIGVRTKGGREKIDNWFKSYQAFATDKNLERLRPLIKYIKKVDRNKTWPK